MIENIRLSFQGIFSHKMRSILTMLGIIIGIASIIAIISTIKGTNDQLLKNMVGAGTNTIKVLLTEGTADNPLDFSYTELPNGVRTLRDNVREKLIALDHVIDASFYRERTSADFVFYNSTKLTSCDVVGIDQSYLSVNGLKLRTGRSFIQRDYDRFRKVVILDEIAASNLFQENNPLGKTLEIKGEPFVVIGVVQKKTSFLPVMNTKDDYDLYMADSATGKVMIPITSWPILFQFDEPQNLIVRADSVEEMAKIGKPCSDLINTELNISDNDIRYRAQNILETVQEQQKINESTNTQLVWIASISLLVGGIGVMNIMLVSVTERTSEIGLKKAIGARKKVILFQFLTEAAVLTSLGGIIGVITGIVMAQMISKLTGSPIGISVPAIAGSVFFSMAIGIVFGFFPSVKAANLNPIDALRHE